MKAKHQWFEIKYFCHFGSRFILICVLPIMSWIWAGFPQMMLENWCIFNRMWSIPCIMIWSSVRSLFIIMWIDRALEILRCWAFQHNSARSMRDGIWKNMYIKWRSQVRFQNKIHKMCFWEDQFSRVDIHLLADLNISSNVYELEQRLFR